MKKLSKLTGGVFVSIVIHIFLFSFISCSNFVDSASFLSELEGAIKYINSESFNVRFSAEGGKISPSGDYSVKVEDKINVIFNCESDKCFINWEVFAGDKLLSLEELSAYIHFDNLDEPETSIKILQKADNLRIQAKTVARPKILSTTPLYDDEGSYRDRRITIMFDQYLDRDSIYFTKEELIEAGVWDSAANCVKSGYTLLDKNGDKKYFGYQKTGDDNSIVWKVATITKRTDKSVNLLKCYEYPEFDSDDTSVLRITTKRNVAQMPPVNSDILVNIKVDFGLQKKTVTGAKKLVTLNSTYSWSYLTNSRYDNEKPIITELVLYNVKGEHINFSTIENNCEKLFDYSNNKDSVDLLSIISNNPNDIPKFNVTDKKIWIKAIVNDAGSGPKSLSATVTKVNNQYFPCDEEEIKDVAYSARVTVTGPNATVYSDENYNGEFFDISGIKDEGLYKITFEASDKNELKSYKEAYFIYDVTPPAQITNFFAGARKEKIDLFYSTPANDDLAKIELSYGSIDTDTEPIILAKSSNSSKQITGLSNGETYNYYIRTVDYAGNKSEPVFVTQKVQVSLGDICYAVNDSSILCSNNYYSGSNIKPIGVVCDLTDYGKATDYSKVRIWDLEEYSSGAWDKIWGSMKSTPYSNENDHFNKDDGLATYKIYRDIYNGGTFYNTKSYWYWLKNTKNVNSTNVIWYIPTYNELLNFIVPNYNSLKTTFDTLKNNTISATLLTLNTNFATCIPAEYKGDSKNGYYRANISSSNNNITISSNVMYRDGNAAYVHCMAQVNLN